MVTLMMMLMKMFWFCAKELPASCGFDRFWRPNNFTKPRQRGGFRNHRPRHNRCFSSFPLHALASGSRCRLVSQASWQAAPMAEKAINVVLDGSHSPASQSSVPAIAGGNFRLAVTLALAVAVAVDVLLVVAVVAVVAVVTVPVAVARPVAVLMTTLAMTTLSVAAPRPCSFSISELRPQSHGSLTAENCCRSLARHFCCGLLWGALWGRGPSRPQGLMVVVVLIYVLSQKYDCGHSRKVQSVLVASFVGPLGTLCWDHPSGPVGTTRWIVDSVLATSTDRTFRSRQPGQCLQDLLSNFATFGVGIFTTCKVGNGRARSPRK